MRMINILAVALLILASCGPGEQKVATPVKKNLTLQLYSFRDDIAKDYDATIKKAGEIGFASIEAAHYDDGKFYNKTPQEFKASIEAAGMKVLSSHTNRGLTDRELASKNMTEALAWWDVAVQAHKDAGMSYVVVPWMAVPKSLKDLQTYCEYYNEIGKRCKEAGMKFGYHNHAHEFEKIEDTIIFDYMLQNTNPEYVFFQMDVYWVVRAGCSPVDYLNKYKGRFEMLHMKDHKELGQSGMVGYDAILKNTDVAGVKHLVVEVENYNFSPEESIKISYDYLQNCSLVKESYE